MRQGTNVKGVGEGLSEGRLVTLMVNEHVSICFCLEVDILCTIVFVLHGIKFRTGDFTNRHIL